MENHSQSSPDGPGAFLCVIDLVFELLSNNQFPLRFLPPPSLPHTLLGAALYITGLLHPLCLNVR